MQHWQWRVDDNQTLTIELGKHISEPLSFKRNVLRDRLPESAAFSMDDAATFQRFADYLDTYSALSATEQFTVALHACALTRFGKLMLPQSWYFKFGILNGEQQWPSEALFCTLNSGTGSADFLIIEQDERCSLCMLVDESFEVGGFRTMQQFEVTRVLNDRLQESSRHPLSRHISQQQWA